MIDVRFAIISMEASSTSRGETLQSGQQYNHAAIHGCVLALHVENLQNLVD